MKEWGEAKGKPWGRVGRVIYWQSGEILVLKQRTLKCKASQSGLFILQPPQMLLATCYVQKASKIPRGGGEVAIKAKKKQKILLCRETDSAACQDQL